MMSYLQGIHKFPVFNICDLSKMKHDVLVNRSLSMTKTREKNKTGTPLGLKSDDDLILWFNCYHGE